MYVIVFINIKTLSCPIIFVQARNTTIGLIVRTIKKKKIAHSVPNHYSIRLTDAVNVTKKKNVIHVGL